MSLRAPNAQILSFLIPLICMMKVTENYRRMVGTVPEELKSSGVSLTQPNLCFCSSKPDARPISLTYSSVMLTLAS